MIVERTDFISVPVTDMERSKQFYGETLGLDRSAPEDQGFPEYQLGENVSLYLLDMKSVGSRVHGAAHGVDRAPRARRRGGAPELEAKGVAFDGDTLDTGVCHMAFFRDPDGNALMLHRRYAPAA